MAEVFQQDRNRGVSERHRLAPRPWQARNFEQLPKAGEELRNKAT